jgi:uncharacterized membrane protein
MIVRGKSTNDVWARAVVAGFATGLRSQIVFAVLSRAARRGDFGADCGPPIGWLRSPLVERLTWLAACGELIADKLPQTPPRIEPRSLAVRVGLGGVAGGIVAGEAGCWWVKGAALGNLGAFAGSFTGYWVRKRMVHATGLPDRAIALVEDAIAIGLGSSVVPDR